MARMEAAQPTPTDDALLRAARGGDRDALDALITRYEPRVYRFGLGMCRDTDDAQDVLQDTFLSMVRSLATFRAESSLSTWLYAIAHHACLKKRRRRASSPPSVDSLDALAPAVRDGLASPAATPEELLAGDELHGTLQAAIGALDSAQREVLLLRDVEGLTAPETAKVLGVSVAAIKSRLHRARLAVRETLAPILSPLRAPDVDGHCRTLLTNFSRHLEGDLSAATCADMEAHLATCPGCQAACASLEEALALCRTLVHAPPTATQDAVRQAIRTCLDTELDKSTRTRSPRRASRHPRDR